MKKIHETVIFAWRFGGLSNIGLVLIATDISSREQKPTAEVSSRNYVEAEISSRSLWQKLEAEVSSRSFF
jgi:hypothetical protein